MRSAEQNEILGTFLDLLEGATADGAGKRASGQKVLWKIDPGHEAAMLRHLARWSQEGETADADSGCHPLVHVAWRALAIAWQELDDGTSTFPILTADSECFSWPVDEVPPHPRHYGPTVIAGGEQ